MSSTLSTVTNILRLAALGSLCFCSLVVMGTAGHQISLTSSGQFYIPGDSFPTTIYYPYQGFAVAVAVITLVIIPPLLVIGFIRRGAIFNYVAVELAVLGLFWIFWLSTASYTSTNLWLFTNCNFDIAAVIDSCHELQALQAFSWLNWLIITGYWPFLVVVALIQQSRGNPVWTTSMNDLKFAPPVVTVVTPGVVYPQQQPVMYASQPIQQQQPVMYASQPIQQQQQVVYPPSVPHSPAPAQSPQIGYIPTPPQQPFPHQGGGHFKESA